MWIDPSEDPKVYPVQGGLPIPDFDDQMMTDASSYPKERWGADFRALLWLAEFAAKPDWATRAADGVSFPPAVDSQDMKDALQELVNLQKNERANAMPEILAQSDNFQMYFCSQLGIYPRTNPKSYLLLKIAARIGEMAMVKIKWNFASGSVRPSQIYPRLTPPIAVPPHASYPSGHSLVSHLLALVALEIEPKFSDAPTRLAQRIARNREIAGLHFWWDSLAGEKVAGNLFTIIKELSGYPTALDNAKAEWA
jgi:acid phosphatase (class A)